MGNGLSGLYLDTENIATRKHFKLVLSLCEVKKQIPDAIEGNPINNTDR